MLFNVPETLGFNNQGHAIDSNTFAAAETVFGMVFNPVSRDQHLHQLLDCYVHIHDICMPTAADDAIDVYAI